MAQRLQDMGVGGFSLRTVAVEKLSNMTIPLGEKSCTIRGKLRKTSSCWADSFAIRDIWLVLAQVPRNTRNWKIIETGIIECERGIFQ